MNIAPDSIRLLHDVDADAVSVQLRDVNQHHTGFPDGVLGGRYIHYDADGNIRAFEFMAVSKGINLQDFPEPEALLAADALLRDRFVIQYDVPGRVKGDESSQDRDGAGH